MHSCHRPLARLILWPNVPRPRVCLRRACTWTMTQRGDRTSSGGRKWRATHQEPVKIHDSEKQQERIEEEVEGNVRHRAQAAVACGIQDLEWEPVEAEPEPAVGRTGQGSCGQERAGRRWPHRLCPVPSGLICLSLLIPTHPCLVAPPSSLSLLCSFLPNHTPCPLHLSPHPARPRQHHQAPPLPTSLSLPPAHQLRLKLRQPRSAARACRGWWEPPRDLK